MTMLTSILVREGSGLSEERPVVMREMSAKPFQGKSMAAGS